MIENRADESSLQVDLEDILALDFHGDDLVPNGVESRVGALDTLFSICESEDELGVAIAQFVHWRQVFSPIEEDLENKLLLFPKLLEEIGGRRRNRLEKLGAEGEVPC